MPSRTSSGFAIIIRKIALETAAWVGEGDFSFAAGLVAHRGGSGEGLTLTSFDSLAAATAKYASARAHVARCLAAAPPARVLHELDATRLDAEPRLAGARFDRVVFNFPHTGQQRVHLNRALVAGFLRAARGRVRAAPPLGEVHVTIKLGPPYDRWGIEALARDEGYIHRATRPFDQRAFPGYRHQTTLSDAKTFVAASAKESRKCRTLVFVYGGAPATEPRAEPTAGVGEL